MSFGIPQTGAFGLPPIYATQQPNLAQMLGLVATGGGNAPQSAMTQPNAGAASPQSIAPLAQAMQGLKPPTDTEGPPGGAASFMTKAMPWLAALQFISSQNQPVQMHGGGYSTGSAGFF